MGSNNRPNSKLSSAASAWNDQGIDISNKASQLIFQNIFNANKRIF